jgi:tryptophanyl-tRNA synthetase
MADRDLSNLGFLGYPLLQTADVIIYNAHFVPVSGTGAHLELWRQSCAGSKFLQLFVSGSRCSADAAAARIDNRKMSKSYGNTINVDTPGCREESPADVPDRSGSAPTFRHGRRQSVFIYHDAFNPNTAEVEDLKAGIAREGDDDEDQLSTTIARSDHSRRRQAVSQFLSVKF